MSANVSCTLCPQVFTSRSGLVQHILRKQCSRGEREKRRVGLTSDTSLDMVPQQNCRTCRWFSKSGMQIYMLQHLAQAHLKTGDRTLPAKKEKVKKVKEVEELEEERMDVESMKCEYCDHFETSNQNDPIPTHVTGVLFL